MVTDSIQSSLLIGALEHMHSDDNLSQAKNELLTVLAKHYKSGLEHYRNSNFKAAEIDFVKSIRPILSKPSMRQIILEEEDALLKIEVLDAIYHLGLIYELGDLNHENNYAKAAAIFIYCAAFSKKHKVSDSELYLKAAYSVEVKFLKGDSSSELSESELQIYKLNISKHKARLIEDRDQVRLGLDSIKDLTISEIAQRTSKVEEIYSDSSKYLVSDEGDGLLQELLSECHIQLGGVPAGCEFTIIGLGSLSVGTITPWSDLEFGILINQDIEEYKEYFRKLTQLLQIKIINLGETHLRSLGIESLNDFSTAREEDEWFWDDVIEAGISFDGKHWHACKSPLGRRDYKAVKNITKDNGVEESIIEEKRDFELILTPHQMVEFQREGGNSWFSTDKHLVQALRRVSLIDGSQKLLDSYRDLASEALHIEILRDRELEILMEDLGKFSLKLTDEEEGKLLDVKKDMYRLGDRVVVSLSNYYEIYPKPGEKSINVWQMIDLMRVKGILSPEGAQHLKEAISIASELRLSTYSHNVGQTQEMSTYIPAINHLDAEQRKTLVEKTFHIKDTKILHYFYNIMIPLQRIVEDFCKQESHISAVIEFPYSDLFQDTDYLNGMVHARFLEYDMALIYLKKSVEQDPGNLLSLNDLFFLYRKTSQIDDAILLGNKILEIIRTDDGYDTAGGYSNLGVAYHLKGEFNLAIENYRKALEIQKITHANNHHISISYSYNNLGLLYAAKGEYDLAIENYQKALEIFRVVYVKSQYNPAIASSYSNLGISYNLQGEYDLSIESHQKALEILRIVYVRSPNHPAIASVYSNLAITYHSRGEFDLAIENHQKALEIFRVAYNTNLAHHDIAMHYNSLGNVYDSKGEYNLAITCYKKALAIQEIVYASNLNHPDIATSYNNLGISYNSKGEYDLAIENHKKALVIQEVAYHANLNHPLIATSYNNLGNAYHSKGEYDLAIENHNKALEIEKLAYSSNPNHPYIASGYDNLGNAYYQKKEYDLAIENHERALEIQKIAYFRNLNHPDIAKSNNNLGNAYRAKGKYDLAIDYYKKALTIQEIAYASNLKHPDIAMSCKNLGRAYDLKKEYGVAIDYYQRVLIIQEKVHADNLDHIDVAASYHNLGRIYCLNGEYDLAIENHEKALAIQKIAYFRNLNHADIATTYNNLGISYHARKDYDFAIKNHQNALLIYQEIYRLDLNHSDIATTYDNLGNSFAAKKDYDVAIDYYQRALAIAEVAYVSNLNHPDIARIHNNLGISYNAKKECNLALEHYHKALKIYEIIDDPTNIAMCYNNLGNAYHFKRSYDLAVEKYEKALEIYKVIYSQNLNHPDILKGYSNLGQSYFACGKYDMATQLYQQHGGAAIIYTLSLLQLGNNALLEGNSDLAMDYYIKFSDNLGGIIDFSSVGIFSKEFIGIQLQLISVQYQKMFVIPEINSLKTVLLLDPDLEYGNHYHNLASCYASLSEFDKANDTFALGIKAPADKVIGALYVEYAQFLIIHRDQSILGDSVDHISDYLYKSINSSDIGSLCYGTLEKDVVCSVLKNLIAEQNYISVNPKILAYHLLLNYPGYIRDTDTVSGIMDAFIEYYSQNKNEISFELFFDAVISTDLNQCLDLIEKIKYFVLESSPVAFTRLEEKLLSTGQEYRLCEINDIEYPANSSELTGDNLDMFN